MPILDDSHYFIPTDACPTSALGKQPKINEDCRRLG